MRRPCSLEMKRRKSEGGGASVKGVSTGIQIEVQ